MGISYALGNALLAAQQYENWAEVLLAIAQRKEPARIILKDGLQITATSALRYLVRAIFYERIYNPAALPIEQNDIVIDIGANCGVFTLFAATSTRNKVYAYEPSPANFAILAHNIAVNQLRNVIPQCCAVSHTVGSAALLLNPRDGQLNMLKEQKDISITRQENRGRGLVSPLLHPRSIDSSLQVPTTSLQAIIEEHHLERIDFLKLDCEGSEGAILTSTPIAYLRKIKKVALEFHDHLSPFSHTHLQAFLEEAGLTTRLRWNGHSSRGYLYAWRA